MKKGLSGSGTVLPRAEAVNEKKRRKSTKAKPSKIPPHELHLALITLNDAFEQASERAFSDAISVMEGLHDTIAHHPGLKRYAKALRKISEAEAVMLDLRIALDRL